MRRDNRFSAILSPFKTYLSAVVHLESGICYDVEIPSKDPKFIKLRFVDNDIVTT